MSSAWDDFVRPPDDTQTRRVGREAQDKLKGAPDEEEGEEEQEEEADGQETGCNWGQHEVNDRPSAIAQYGKPKDDESNCPGFISLYEQYLSSKKSIPQQTKNYKAYSKNPQKYLRDWFDNEGHDEMKLSTDQPSENQYICTVELPIDEHDFTLTSELHPRKKDAADEVCLDACRLLDSCQLLLTSTFSSSNQFDGDEGEDHNRKRRIDEANKEDDIEFDGTTTWKRHRNEPATSDNNKVNTYESLLARWRAVNMSILQLKAKLVKLDLSVTKQKLPGPPGGKESVRGDNRDNNASDGDSEDETDPLDEFMSNLETKTALSMDDKIEKSRLRTQIATQEREQSRLARMIELAKPAGK